MIVVFRQDDVNNTLYGACQRSVNEGHQWSCYSGHKAAHQPQGPLEKPETSDEYVNRLLNNGKQQVVEGLENSAQSRYDVGDIGDPREYISYHVRD